jgi:mannosylglycerate hydrolase
MRCVLVSHTHWDREWYRTFQSFRARLVDTVDRVLDLVAEDPGFHFQLDGQTIVLEDYAEIRPERCAELAAACRAGRIAIGPWYVQPDSFLPSGEAHVRNLLEGRRVAGEWGPCATVAYTPDSFGHPAQLPQIFAGFGLGPFIYWRGNGNEIAELPAEYRWIAPDGSHVDACHLGRGYFNANGLPRDVDAAVARLEKMALELAERAPRPCVLLMNGVDHMLPDANTGPVSEALAKHTGWQVDRGLLDDYAGGLEASPPSVDFAGELCGGRVANLLPGVWSTRTYLKLRNRRCESWLEGWAEPSAAIGAALGTPSERASIRLAWRDLLANQAHDSICGCSQDRVHDQMLARYDTAEELARETTDRLRERIAGLGNERQVPRLEPDGERRKTVEIAVFNPSPHPRTDVVRLPLDGFPTATSEGVNPLLSKNHAATGFRIDGEPARLVPDEGTVRPRLAPDQPVYDVEFVARDVPAFGWKSLTLARSESSPESRDDGREIANEHLVLRVGEDGRFEIESGGQRYPGLLGFEDTGDRGDTYDYDPAPPAAGVPDLGERTVRVSRFRHASGIERLVVERTLVVPAGLADGRAGRSRETVELPIRVEARVAPGVERVDLSLKIENRARDHRLRVLFPTARQDGDEAQAATTFDIATRRPGHADDTQWIHPAPSTFIHQGWIARGGLVVMAPGLNEGEITADGDIAVTLLRATGWLSRPDLTTRPGDAGPALPTPGAQCLGPLEARISLAMTSPDVAPNRARDAELGLLATAAGGEPLWPAGQPLLSIEPRSVVLSAWKPAETGEGSVLRLLNPTGRDVVAQVRLALPTDGAHAVRLDESGSDDAIETRGEELRVPMPAHALRSIRLP